ncbi:hypothetical protein ACJMK2_006489 [Sinanodonta woodiana]|uniref:Succinate dehydrogenase [ubiquinone] cytochrome b small subunit n=1 Tax=Sinanodonta woodiana TaxID=1069815 RepID=A0ABD3VTA3_SINWO
MATVNLLRCCQGARLLLRPQIVKHTLPGLAHPDVASRAITFTAPSLSALDFFRARRGPFTPAEKKGHHKLMASTHWKVERLVAIGMIGIMPTCLFYHAPIMDHLLSTFVLLHGYWGMEGVCTDYIEKFFPYIHYIWRAVTILAFAGLVHFNYNDVGVCKAIAMLWQL